MRGVSGRGRSMHKFTEVDCIMIRLAKFHSEFGKIEVLRAKNTGSVIYRQGGFYQSESDINGVSVAPYIHAIFGLLAQTQARNVLMIGCGGGSLGTMLDKTGVRVTIVDINPTAFFIARKYFGLPHHIECYVEDGLNFLHAVRHRYDAIILDAYTGGDIPDHLCTETFFELAHARLDETNGCLISNIWAHNDRDQFPKEMAEKLSNIWTDVRLLDTPGLWDRNTLLVAGEVEHFNAPTLLMPPTDVADDVARDLERFRFIPWRRSEQLV